MQHKWEIPQNYHTFALFDPPKKQIIMAPEVQQFAPEKLPKPNRKGLSSDHLVSGTMFNFGGVYGLKPPPSLLLKCQGRY